MSAAADPPAPSADRGAAALWVLACGALVLAVGAVVVVRGLAVLARHRAEAAADFAALAAAGRIGVGADPCGAARAVAAANGAVLRACMVRLDPSGRSGTVRVQVSLPVDLPIVGGGDASARARAERLPGRLAPMNSARHVRGSTCRDHCVWHAGAGRTRSNPRVNSGDGAPTPFVATRDGRRVELSVTRQGPAEVPVVAVSGEVDVYAAPALKDGLSELLQDGSSVVVDLTEVGFLDSTGLGALVSARTTAAEHGATLPLVCTHQRILKLFTITGLDGVFRIHDSVDDALARVDEVDDEVGDSTD